MRTWFLALVAVLAATVAALLVVLHPPQRLTLAAGPEHGAYAALARKYRAILARDGIRLDIVNTAGSAENAELISAGRADAAILQGGIKVPDADVEAIGTIFYEPMIFLARRGAVIPGNPAHWSGLRISSGKPGSGTAAVFRDFQAAVGLRASANRHLALSYDDAVLALAAGDIDLAVFVSPVNAPYLVDAYAEPAIRLLAIDNTETISRRLAYATTVTLPPGAISLSRVVPPSPLRLLALEARLAVSGDLHPALVNRLTMAAIELHRARDIITDPGRFPSAEGAGMPVNNAARQLILEGPTTWHDWLPYWMAAQVNRMLLLVLPFLFIVVPLIRALPGIYAFAMQWKVWQHYPEIRLIEDELATVTHDDDLARMDARLADLDARLVALRVPAAYRQTAYNARIHVEMVRRRIAEMRQAPDG